jgi:hypothetical protein
MALLNFCEGRALLVLLSTFQLLYGLGWEKVLKCRKEEVVPILALGLQALEQGNRGLVGGNAGH